MLTRAAHTASYRAATRGSGCPGSEFQHPARRRTSELFVWRSIRRQAQKVRRRRTVAVASDSRSSKCPVRHFRYGDSTRSGNLFRRATELPALRPLNPLGGNLGCIHLPHWATAGSSIDPGRGTPKAHEKVERPAGTDDTRWLQVPNRPRFARDRPRWLQTSIKNATLRWRSDRRRRSRRSRDELLHGANRRRNS